MNIENIKITPSDGYILHHKTIEGIWTESVFLGRNDSADNWEEIPISLALERQEQEREEQEKKRKEEEALARYRAESERAVEI